MKMFEVEHIISYLIVFHTTYLSNLSCFFSCFGLGSDCFCCYCFCVQHFLFMEIYFGTGLFPYTARTFFKGNWNVNFQNEIMWETDL